MSLRCGSLFAGIGGFDLAARWMGWSTAWYSEIDPYCNAVMAHHFPEARALGDITKIDWSQVEPVDMLFGGFPCQDVSQTGKRAGLEGARSGLWWEFHRALRELRPRYAVVENVPGLFVRGFDDVLGSLADIGYDAEWRVLSAADVGAPHLRKRVWITAFPNGLPVADASSSRRATQGSATPGEAESGAPLGGPLGCGALADSIGLPRCEGGSSDAPEGSRGRHLDRGSFRPDVADPESERLEGRPPARHEISASGVRLLPPGQGEQGGGHHWTVEPRVGRLAHGVPHRLAQLRALGNSIVPQCAYQIFQSLALSVVYQENQTR